MSNYICPKVETIFNLGLYLKCYGKFEIKGKL